MKNHLHHDLICIVAAPGDTSGRLGTNGMRHCTNTEETIRQAQGNNEKKTFWPA